MADCALTSILDGAGVVHGWDASDMKIGAAVMRQTLSN